MKINTTNITKTATLGTSRAGGSILDLPKELLQIVAENESDTEDAFLKSIALVFAINEAGFNGVEIKGEFPVCPNETKPIAPAEITHYFKKYLQESDAVLVSYLLTNFRKRGIIVPGFLVSDLMYFNQRNKIDPQLLSDVEGETGKWLRSINPDWANKSSISDSDENIWETGSPAIRKQWFKSLLKNDPNTARLILSESFSAENADMREFLVDALSQKINSDDQPFFESCLSDRSIKVRNAAYRALCFIPGSDISKACLNYLKKAIQIDEQRVMLIKKKKVIHFAFPGKPEKILLDAGVEETSNIKQLTDAVFIAGQIIGLTNPELISQTLGISEYELIQLLLSHENVDFLAPFAAMSATHFKNKKWAKALIESEKVLISSEMISFFSVYEKKELAQKLARSMQINELIDQFTDGEYTVIDPGVSEIIFNQLLEHPYNVDSPKIRELSLYLPVSITGMLESYKTEFTKLENHFWIKRLDEMLDIINLKKQLNSNNLLN
ncbi:MAG: hypothetical protein GC181_15835 [Bacteroidetes bacterium]|nr:hypothetical protein [Bacteroidota bacterium]